MYAIRCIQHQNACFDTCIMQFKPTFKNLDIKTSVRSQRYPTKTRKFPIQYIYCNIV